MEREIAQWVHPMKDRSDDPSHHERTLLARSYISLPERESERERESNIYIYIYVCVETEKKKERKEMFYLMIQLFGVGHVVKNYSDSERGNLLLLFNGLLFLISSKGVYMYHPTYRTIHNTTLVTPVVEHWLKQKK